jgi:hypothetical protein
LSNPTYSREEAAKLIYADSSKMSDDSAAKPYPKNMSYPSYSLEEAISLINNISFKNVPRERGEDKKNKSSSSKQKPRKTR